MTKRRSLTPIAGMPPVVPGTHAMRRVDARKEVSDRVTVRPIRREIGTGENEAAPGENGSPGPVCEGWALNASRGGLRAIVETNESGVVIELGGEYEVIVGDPEAVAPKKARVVWVQDEPDGVVVGFEYIGLSGTHRAAISSGPRASPESVASEKGDGASGNSVSGTTAKAPAVTFASESDSRLPIASSASTLASTPSPELALHPSSAAGAPDVDEDDELPTPVKE